MAKDNTSTSPISLDRSMFVLLPNRWAEFAMTAKKHHYNNRMYCNNYNTIPYAHRLSCRMAKDIHQQVWFRKINRCLFCFRIVRQSWGWLWTSITIVTQCTVTTTLTIWVWYGNGTIPSRQWYIVWYVHTNGSLGEVGIYFSECQNERMYYYRGM